MRDAIVGPEDTLESLQRKGLTPEEAQLALKFGEWLAGGGGDLKAGEAMTCRGPDCRKKIRLVATPKGKRMPLDVRPTPEGTFRIKDGVAHQLAGDELAAARNAFEPLYVTHFATCANSRRFSRPKKGGR